MCTGVSRSIFKLHRPATSTWEWLPEEAALTFNLEYWHCVWVTTVIGVGSRYIHQEVVKCALFRITALSFFPLGNRLVSLDCFSYQSWCSWPRWSGETMNGDGEREPGILAVPEAECVPSGLTGAFCHQQLWEGGWRESHFCWWFVLSTSFSLFAWGTQQMPPWSQERTWRPYGHCWLSPCWQGWPEGEGFLK